MKAMQRAAIALAMLTSLSALICGCALSQGSQAKIKTSRLAMSGDTVQLVYAGDQTVKDHFCVEGTATVYRFFPPWASVHQRDEMGQVRITRILDDRTLEGVVLEGKVLTGDTVLQRYGDCVGKMPKG